MAHKTIVLVGDLFQKEGKAGGTITPGMLIKRTSVVGTVAVHAGSGQQAQKLFALEDSLQGNEIGDNYTVGNRVQFHCARPGDEIFALLKDGQNVAAGDYLQSGGDGTLIKYTAGSAGVVEYPNSIVAVALEAVDLSASANTANARIQVEVV